MAVFDPKEVIVLLDGREISDWSDGSDVINGFMQQFEVYQHEETNEYVIERTMFRNDEVIGFNQSEAMNAEQAQTLWKMYTVH